MDEGITARQLVKDVEKITKDKSIKAVVFRVDSPGGDGLASDIVAEAIKKCTEKKPVIVSQGWVAGSGGYWLSMYGDKIVASPVTITGSIGVIGGWMYDTGLKDKLGLTTDKVQVGDHADLGFGAVLPFIGALVPDRNLTEHERSTVEYEIKTMYRDFVQKVADGRNKTYDQIESIAQGRVWSGADGYVNGLVDTLGGLELALKLAKDMAGISEKSDIEIIEYPKRKMLSPDIFKPKLLSIDARTEKTVDIIRFYLDHNGKPLPMMPLEFIDMTLE
jgi:protease-4